MPANRVEVEIAAKASGFSAAFSKITSEAQSASSRIAGSFGALKSAAAGLGLALSAAGFAAFVKGAVDAADRLNDLSKATGVGVTTLGGIGFAAEQAGTDLDGVAKAFAKLNLYVADAQAGNEKALKTFEKLGISINELRTLKPEEVFARTADAFSQYEDDANKAAGANLIFGKSYQSILPFLDEGGEALRKNIAYYQRYSGVTEDLVQASDQFNDSLTKLNLLNRAFGNHLAASLLPSLNRFVEYLAEGKEKGDGFKETASLIADGLKGLAKFALASAFALKDFGSFLGSIAAQASALASFDFARVSAIGEDYDQQVEKSKKRLIELKAIFDDTSAAAAGIGAPGSGSGRRRRPTPSFGDAGGTGAAAKEKADEFAKALERVAKLASDADFELKAAFSTEEITGAQRALAQLVASDAWQQFTEPQQQALTARYQMIDAVQRETSEWKRKREETEKEIEALKRLQEEQQQAVQAFTANLGQYAEDNANLEKHIALIGQDDLARAKLAETIEYERLQKQALLADDQAGLAILEEQYRKRISLIEQLDAATKHFRDVQQYNAIFTDSLANGLTDIVTRAKSVKEAFLDMGRSIAEAITRIASQNLAEQIFGVSSTGGGGIGELFAKLFGSGQSGGAAGGAAGAAALTGSATALTASSTALDLSATALVTAATSLTAAGAALAASSAASTASSVAGSFIGPSLGFFAGGTSFAPGGLAVVGERGPELVSLPRGSRVRSAPETSRLIGGNTVVQNFYVPSRANTETMRHQAKSGWRAAAGAQRRG